MSETSYKVTWSQGPTYAVEVTEPNGKRRTVSPFARHEEAEAWIAKAKWKGAPGRDRPPMPKKPR